jgi:hypothetical protein
MLVKAGADVNAVEGTQPDQYTTALDAAYKRPEIAGYLRQQGAETWSELDDRSP